MTERNARGIFRHNAVRAALFACLIGIVLILCSFIFDYDDAERSQTVVDQFYDLDKDTVDLIYMGASSTQRAFVEPVAYHDHGIAGYSYTCGTQPFVLTKFLMEETLKTQEPELFVIELRGVCKTAEGFPNIGFRRMIDNMKPSMNKYRAIRYVLDYASHGENKVDATGLSYYFPIMQYHSRWNPSKKPKYLDMDYYKGFGIDPDWYFLVHEEYPPENTGEKQRLAPESEDVLNDLLDYCDKIEARVLFVVSPYGPSEKGQRKLNTATKIVRDRGYECLNFLEEEEREMLGVDNRTWFYNHEHLNYYGALRYTGFISNHAKKKYGVSDRRGDGRHKSWEQDYKRLMENLEGKYAKKYSEMMAEIDRIQDGAE